MIIGGPDKSGLVAMLLVGDILQLPNRKHKFYIIEKKYQTKSGEIVAKVRPIDENGEPIKSEPLEKF